jgi:16S rRNA (cytosine1402-N4)-methyltransferase
MSNNNSHHQPVLLSEVLELLTPQPGKVFVDATFGRGGHSRALLEQGARVIAFDFDQNSIEQAQANFAKELASKQLILIRENFGRLQSELAKLSSDWTNQLNGILFDFGTSTDQLMSKERGFSFDAADETLDMRMDERLGVKACDLLKLLDEKQLAQMLFEYGGEEQARSIAKRIVAQRKSDPNSLDQVATLVAIIESVKARRPGQLHPATKTFQALRIIVNDEISNIEAALPQALAVMRRSSATDKKIVCISFHEGEDRLVKTFFKQIEQDNLGKILTKKTLTASDSELATNPRSRSAKLRAIAL